MRVGIIIPDRGDRPEFLDNCKRMIRAQKFEGEIVSHYSSYPPKDDSIDIVPRVMLSYSLISKDHYDVVVIMENDDWYATDYIATMVDAWIKHGKPDLFGTCYTIYYHLQLKAHNKMEHHQRASLMNTLIRPGLDFKWPVEIEPYLDLHLWGTIQNRIVFRPDKHISIGMKHNVGKCGGAMHAVDHRTERWYINPDNGFLKATLDPESFDFYNNYFDNGKSH